MSEPANWAGIEFCESTNWTSRDLRIDHHATGWSGQLSRALEVDAQTVALDDLTVSVVSIRLQSKLPQTIGFAFPEAIDLLARDKTVEFKQQTTPTVQTVSAPTTNSADAKSRTRIKPPADLVKLEDRLYFVLQPPLETLVNSA